MAEVNVYDVPAGGGFVKDLGKTVLPASVPAFDFSALDKVLETEKEIANKSLETVQANLQAYASVEDELTGINMVSPESQMGRLEAAKKSVGLDNNAFKSALSNMDNPSAIYELDRKMKKLSQHPDVKQILYENAVAEAFRTQIQDIEDPYLRAQAISDYEAAITDKTGQGLKKLSIKDYESIDLETEYQKVLDKFAPLGQEDRWVTDENGNEYLETVIIDRDPAAVQQAREYWRKNKGVNANLRARGVIDENGEPVQGQEGTRNWFEALEAAPKQNQIRNVRSGRSNIKAGGGASSIGAYTSMRTTPGQFQSMTDLDIETIDLGAIAAVETGGRSPDKVVHPSPETTQTGTNTINVGAFSFTGANAKTYVQELQNLIENDPNATEEAKNIAYRLANYNYNNTKDIDKVKADYAKLESIMGENYMIGQETDHVSKKFVRPALANFFQHFDRAAKYSYLGTGTKTGFRPSQGLLLILADTGINHGKYATIFENAAKAINKIIDNGGAGLTTAAIIDEIAKARISYVNSLTATQLNPELKKPVIARIQQIAQEAKRMDADTQPRAEYGNTPSRNASGFESSLFGSTTKTTPSAPAASESGKTGEFKGRSFTVTEKG